VNKDVYNLTARKNEIKLFTKQYCIVCLLLVLKSFMRNRYATKSREFN